MIKKNTTNKIFRQVKFVEVKRIFLLVYTNEDAAAKKHKILKLLVNTLYKSNGN